MFKDTSMTMELSPDKKKSVSKKSQMSQMSIGSPLRDSHISKRSSQISTGGPSPARNSNMLDMHKKTGIELK
jgi:hypothetical protein